MKRKWFKRAGIVLAAALLYLAVGAAAPFAKQPEIQKETRERFLQTDFYADGAGNERAALLTENEEALTERLRLLEGARERIVLSTFVFRRVESG